MKCPPEMVGYPLLPAPAGARPARPLRICIASFDFVGPVRNGGVGTAFTSLGEAMAASGHEVTLLFLAGRWCENRTMDYWVDYYHKKGIRFVPMPDTELRVESRFNIAKGYEGYLWLQKHNFDIIHFSEWKGPGYFTMLAKQQGLAFANTLLCVHTHGPTLWHKLSNAEYVTQVDDLEVDYVERSSVKMADVVVSPSQYLLRWMRDCDWALPENCYVRQYVRPATARKPQPNADRVHRVKELVFFGRLEVRKGLVLFCDALDHLKNDPKLRHATITFLGKVDKVGGRDSAEYLADRAKQWPWKWQIVSDRDQAGAMDYLQGRERLALLPSLVDNLPNTVLECLGAQVPFLASDAGGIPEMIAASDLETTCFPLRARPFAEKLRHALSAGVRPARSAVDAQENERAWVRWHESLPLADAHQVSLEAVTLAITQPLVSICMSHWNRPAYLGQALTSIEAQDYPNCEVVLVDDGSTDPEARKLISSLEAEFARKGWQLLRQAENRYPGASRNLAARHARGEFILFMDDDNCAKPHAVSTFVRIARKTGADILTCCLDTFSGQDAPHAQLVPKTRWLFLGPDVATGALRNNFGDTNSLWRREVFLALGGFHEDWGVGHEDWELHAKAVLKGYQLQVVPEPLAWYRLNDTEATVNRKTPLHANLMANIRPYLEAVPPALRQVVRLVQGQLMASLEAAQRLRVLEETANRNSTETPYAQATIQWRSALTAGRHLLTRRVPEAARELFIEAVKTAEASKNSQVILEALLEITPALAELDPGRARFLTELAVKLAGSLHKPAELQRARQTLATLPGASAIPSSPAAHPAPVIPAEDLLRPRFTAGVVPWVTPTAPVLLPGALGSAAAHLNGGEPAEALVLLDRLASELPEAARLHYGRALALAGLGRHAEALEALGSVPEAERTQGRLRQFEQELRDRVPSTLPRP